MALSRFFGLKIKNLTFLLNLIINLNRIMLENKIIKHIQVFYLSKPGHATVRIR
jgi:hypothetical protein